MMYAVRMAVSNGRNGGSIVNGILVASDFPSQGVLLSPPGAWLPFIGFSDFADRKFLEQTFDGDWAIFEQWFDDEWGQNPRTRYNLWRFIAEMRKGDWVVVPSLGTFSVYEVIEDKPQMFQDLEIRTLIDAEGRSVYRDQDGYICVKKTRETTSSEREIIDLGFLRKVKPVVEGVSRYDYADRALPLG